MRCDWKCIYIDLVTHCNTSLPRIELFLFLHCPYVFTCTSDCIAPQAKILSTRRCYIDLALYSCFLLLFTLCLISPLSDCINFHPSSCPLSVSPILLLFARGSVVTRSARTADAIPAYVETLFRATAVHFGFNYDKMCINNTTMCSDWVLWRN